MSFTRRSQQCILREMQVFSTSHERDTYNKLSVSYFHGNIQLQKAVIAFWPWLELLFNLMVLFHIHVWDIIFDRLFIACGGYFLLVRFLDFCMVVTLRQETITVETLMEISSSLEGMINLAIKTRNKQACVRQGNRNVQYRFCRDSSQKFLNLVLLLVE